MAITQNLQISYHNLLLILFILVYFVVKMVPLPPGRNRQGVIYMNKELKPFLKSKDIPRTNILIKNCHKWSEFKEKPQEKVNGYFTTLVWKNITTML